METGRVAVAVGFGVGTGIGVLVGERVGIGVMAPKNSAISAPVAAPGEKWSAETFEHECSDADKTWLSDSLA